MAVAVCCCSRPPERGRLQGPDWWRHGVLCAKVEKLPQDLGFSWWGWGWGWWNESGKARFFRGDGEDNGVKLTVLDLREPPYLLLSRHLDRHVVAFTEWRQTFWKQQPSTFKAYHAFVMMEIGDSDLSFTCEKKGDKLEIMFGEGATPHRFMRELRATGDARDPGRLVEQARQELVHTVTVRRLLEWIDGPLARMWEPYDFFRSNCQHFSADLQGFLRHPYRDWGNVVHVKQLKSNEHPREHYISSASYELTVFPEA